MTNLMTRIFILSAVLFGAPLMAQANGKMLSPEQMERHMAAQKAKAASLKRMSAYHDHMRKGDSFKGGHMPKASVVPELDPNASGSAAVLVAGGALVLLGRRRRQLAE